VPAGGRLLPMIAFAVTNSAQHASLLLLVQTGRGLDCMKNLAKPMIWFVAGLLMGT
jgi:hypothetical protein